MVATENNEYLEKAIKWAESKGFKDLKSQHEDYEQPFSFTNQQNQEEFTPQITANKDGRKNYIELAMKNEEVSKTVSKWRLLSTMADMKGGKLYLLAPRGHKAFTDNILNDYPIKATLISI